MTGNVYEWVNDWGRPDYYTVSPPVDPFGPATGTVRILRGGSWATYHYATNLRVDFRLYGLPDFVVRFIGFHCARGSAYGP